MKWLPAIILFPTFTWGACEGLKTAVESCTPYSCEIVTAMIGKVAGLNVKGREGDACIIVTDFIKENENGKTRVTNCRVLVKALPFMAKQLATETELLEMAMELNLTIVKRSHDEQNKKTGLMVQKQQAYHLIKEELAKNLLTANDGKVPCVQKK